ncbi:MAG: alpha/beta fold hydrolase [Planctomycetia bacterium]|nr:alpha/beta fold hydrolase [Planctomycetia bacterium]
MRCQIVRALRVGCLLLLGTVASQRAALAAEVSDFIDFSFSGGPGSLPLPGRLYVPPEATSDPTTPRPFILFLHGAGESGSNNTAQVNGNIDNLLAEAKVRGAFLYAPQTNFGWDNSTITTEVNAMIDRALAQDNVDVNRLYVTGLSMGGGGTWNMLNRFPDRFAAGVPIAGVFPASDFVPARLVDQAIWAFHARNDGTVNVQRSRNTVASILAIVHESPPPTPSGFDFTTTVQFSAQTIDLHYTEYPLGGHGIWPRVYSEPTMYDWMFAHSVPEPSAAFLMAIGGAGLVAFRRRGHGAR